MQAQQQPFTHQVRSIMRAHGVQTCDIWTNKHKKFRTVKAALWSGVKDVQALQNSLAALCRAANNGSEVVFRVNGNGMRGGWMANSMLVHIPHEQV